MIGHDAIVHLHAETCAVCHVAIKPDLAKHVHVGGLWYHRECAPTCRTCGRSMDDDESVWSVRAFIEPTPNGYVQRLTDVLCPICLDGAIRDEAPYLD